jgi:DNA polymerase III gamma/tau subunit
MYLGAEHIAFEPAAVRLVAQAADGSMRDGLSLLDQLLAFGGGEASEAAARAMLATVDRKQVVRIAQLSAARASPVRCSNMRGRSTNGPRITATCSMRSRRCWCAWR